MAVSKVEVGDFALKSVSEDAMSSIGRRLAGDKNRALFVGSAAYDDSASKWSIAGPGVEGSYSLEFSVAEIT